MTRDEAIEEVGFLKGLFPMFTVEQGRYWLERLQQFPQPAVRRAITRFADRHSDFVDRVGLLDLIHAEAKRAYAPKDPAAERAAADAHWAEVEATLAALTLEQRDKLRAVALAAMPADARAFLEGRGERASRMLAAVMFKRLAEARAKRAVKAAPAGA